MKKIAIISTTRAEYGLFSPVIHELRKHENDQLYVELVVTGTHLSEQFGSTIHEIEEERLRIDHEIPIDIRTTAETDISVVQANVLVKFTDLFVNERYDAVLLLGDRYETLSIAIAAGNTRTPVFHLCGGDTTEGALDEWIRHSITKISYLHFVTNDKSRKRVIQLGEDPARVFNYGSTSIDNILAIGNMNKKQVLNSIGLSDCEYALCTYHPVTMDGGLVDESVMSIIEAIKRCPNVEFIFTKANADLGGVRINELLECAEKDIKNLHVYDSLGFIRYLSLMKYAEFILGNSSSGIIEAPALRVPTVNIGDRQRGRLKSDSVIDCCEKTVDIVRSIKIAMSDEHKQLCRTVISPYGDGHAAKHIADKTIEVVTNGRIDLKKKFFDL